MIRRLFIATIMSAVPAIAGPALAEKPAAATGGKSVGQLIEQCMQDIERGHTAGRKMTLQQRMTAEAQCRARAEAELANAKK